MPFRDGPQSIDETDLAIERARQSNPQVPDAVWDAIQQLGHQVGRVRHDVASTNQTLIALRERLYGYHGDGHNNGDVGDLRQSQERLLRLAWAILLVLLTGLVTLIVVLLQLRRT